MNRREALNYLGVLVFASCTGLGIYNMATDGPWKRELAKQGRKVEFDMDEIGIHGWHDLTSLERIQRENELEELVYDYKVRQPDGLLKNSGLLVKGGIEEFTSIRFNLVVRLNL
ncbi:hypothetical protein HYU92_04300 [Candidatus Curtissbacteria bacterium]|nr:hypothetical protein [Candidatus Curtissbacteria bacterium]